SLLRGIVELLAQDLLRGAERELHHLLLELLLGLLALARDLVERPLQPSRRFGLRLGLDLARDALALDDRFLAAAARLGIGGAQLLLVAGLELPGFVLGALRLAEIL